MQGQRPELNWTSGEVPVSTRFDDPYFSLEDGLAETGHVFLAGNGLPERFAPGFHIAELGFGTGLNFLATLALWQRAGAPAPVHFTSFEAYPIAPGDMGRALAAFPTLAGQTSALLGCWTGRGGVCTPAPGMTLTVVIGDARETLPQWQGAADAWFLDGFSPAKNPELWGDDLLCAVAAHTAPGGTAATYSAAGGVRRALAAAGFDVSRVPGYGRKRHMTRGVLAK